MAPRSSGANTREPFKAFCEDLSNALQNQGSVVKLPKKTIDKIKGLADENKENKHVFSSKDIVELVTILDSDPDENVCDLFDGNTFLAVLQILLLSEWCRAAERGLYLLMSALHQETSAAKSPAARAALMEKMAVIGNKAFRNLLDFFLDKDNEEDHTRIWVGLLILVLYKECEENKNQFKYIASKTFRRKLGELIRNEDENEIARIVDGKLLAAFLKAGLEKEDFVPADVAAAFCAEFPLSQVNRGWNRDFQTWAEKFVEFCSGVVCFPQGVQLIPNVFDFVGKDFDLSLAISKSEISIYAQANKGDPDQRLDIPMNLISGDPWMEPATSTFTKKLRPFCVVIPFREVASNSGEKPCFLNARPCFPEQIREIRITVQSDDHANDILKEIGDVTGKVANVGKIGNNLQESNNSHGSRRPSQPLHALHLRGTAPVDEDGETESNSNDSGKELPDFADFKKLDKTSERGLDKVISGKDPARDEETATTTIKDVQPEADTTPGNPRGNLMHDRQNPSPGFQTPFHKMVDLDLQSDDNTGDVQNSRVDEMNGKPKSQSGPHVSPSISRPGSNAETLTPGSIAETPSPDPIAVLGPTVDDEIPRLNILQRAAQSEHRQDLSVGNDTTQKRSDTRNSETSSRQSKSVKQTAAKEAEIVASVPSRETENQPQKGRSSQNKPINEVERHENGSEGQIATKDGEKAIDALHSQHPPRGPSDANGENSDSQKAGAKSQPRTSLPTGEKCKETSALSGRTKPNELEAVTFEDGDDLTSPEPQDASTPKTAQNVALRAKNPQAIDKQNEPVVKRNNVLKARIPSKSRPSTGKKYSLKSKPAISVAKPVSKATGRGKKVGQSGQGSQMKAKDATISKNTQAKAKSSTQPSDSSMAKPNEKAATQENERNVFDMPSDDEDDPKPNKVNRKAAVKSTKSKGSKTSAKTTTKKAAPEKKQPASEAVNDNVAPRRSQRRAAAAATSKMSQLSSEADAEEHEEIEEPKPGQPAAIEKKPRSPVLKTQMKAPGQTPARGPARGKDSSTLRAKVGIRARKAVTENELSKMVASKVSDNKLNSSPDEEEIFQQLHDDAIELNLAHEPPDAVDRISNADTPIAQGREKASKKRRSDMAAALKGMIGDMKLDKSKEDDGHISYRARLQNPDLPTDKQGPSGVALGEQERRESSPLRISPSPEVQLTLQNKKSNQDGKATQKTTSQKSIVVPRVDERDGSDNESNVAKRRRLNVQQAGPSATSDAPKDSKSKKAISKAVKASTPPLRRSSRLNSPAVEESGVMRSAMRRNQGLVNPKMSRKTPIIAFGKNGPKNQGLSSSKRTSAQQQDETPSKSQTTGKVSLSQPKRKRDDRPGIGELVDRPHKRVDSKQHPSWRPSQEQHTMAEKDTPEIPAMVKGHDTNEPRRDESIFPDPGTPKSDASSVSTPGSVAPPKQATTGEVLVLRSSPFNFIMPVQQSSLSRIIPVKTSKVDDNGSPIKSSTPTDRAKALQGLVQEEEEELRQRSQQMDDVDMLPPQTIAESHTRFEPLSSNVKARPAVPGAERGQYIPHREAGGDKYEDMTSEKVVHQKRFTEDPFAGGPSRRKPSFLTERFIASRSSQPVEKSVVDMPVNLPAGRSQPIEGSIVDVPVNFIASGSQPLGKRMVDMPVKPKQRFRSGNDKAQLAEPIEENIGVAKTKHDQLSKPADNEVQPTKSCGMDVEMSEEVEPVQHPKSTNEKVIVGKNSVIADVMKSSMARDKPVQHPVPTDDMVRVTEHGAENLEVANDEPVQHSKPASIITDVMKDLGLTKDEPVQYPKTSNSQVQLIEVAETSIAVVQDKPAERSQSGTDGSLTTKHTVLVVDEVIERTDAANEQSKAQPESRKPTLRSETIQTRVEKSQEVIMNGPVKRKISFEIEQEDDNSQKKRRKTILKVQKWTEEVEDEGHVGVQNRVEEYLSPVEHFSQSVNGAGMEKPSSQGQREKSGTGDREPQGRTRKRAANLLSMLENSPQVVPEVVSRKPLLQMKKNVKDRHREVIQPRVADSSLDLANARPTSSLLPNHGDKSDFEDHDIHDGIQHLAPNVSQGLVKARPLRLAVHGDSVEAEDEGRQERVQYRVTNHLPGLSRARSQKPSFQTADTALDEEAAQPKKKPASKIENRQTHQPAPEEAEVPAQKTNSRPTQRRISRERPIVKSTRRSRGEGDDPEKTLVEEQPPPPPSSPSSPSDMTSGSSASSHSESPAAFPAPKGLSQEEEWGAQLRSHDRPILQSLYRIVNGLVSHLVEQREAIDTVVEDFEDGGTALVEMLEDNQQNEKDDMTAKFESAKTQLTNSYTNAQRTIASGAKEGSTSLILGIEKKWREEHDALQSLIAESMEDEE